MGRLCLPWRAPPERRLLPDDEVDMPIDVTCPGCRKTLRAPDTLAGKRVKCPQCGGAIAVPAPARAAAPPAGFGGVADLIDEAIQEEVTKRKAAEEAEFERQQDEEIRKVYEDPKAKAAEKREKGLTRFRKRPLRVGDAFSRGWALFTGNYGLCLLVMLFSSFGGMVANVAVLALFGAIGFGIALLVAQGDPAIAGILFLIVYTVGYIVSMIVPAMLWVGTINVYLRLARGETAEFTDVFRAARHTIGFWGGFILWSLIQLLPFASFPVIFIWDLFSGGNVPAFMMYVAGISLLILYPVSVYLSLKYSLFAYAVVDLEVGGIDGFNSAGEIASGNMLQLLGLTVLLVGMNVLGLLTLAIGFLFFTLPLSIMILAVAYTDMVGKKPKTSA